MRNQQKNYPRPIMAVLLNSESISDLKRQITKPWFRLLAEANQEVKNTLYFFSLRDVKLNEHRIMGYYWNHSSKKWLHQDFPYPDIFYIRSGVSKRYTNTYRELCKIVRNKNGKLITHTTFNKWRLYEVLSQDPVMKSYLPATMTVKQPGDIEKMLQYYKVVYLKSHIGRKGENVIRVEALPHGGYQYSYYRNELLTVKSLTDYSALLNEINSFFRGRSFLIQQAIQLLKFDNRLVDMRAELQNNGEGGLDIVGISVRCGQPCSPITTHGDAFSFDDFFVNKMGYSKEQLETFRSEVHKFLTGVYEYLISNYGKYAEIGIDFAIDPDNKIWFIEANSRSTKVSLNKAYGDEALQKNAKTILEYARYLFIRSKRSVKKHAVNDSPRQRAVPKPEKTSGLRYTRDKHDVANPSRDEIKPRYAPRCFKVEGSKRSGVFL